MNYPQHKNKRLLEEAARRLAEIFIAELERTKNKKENN